MVKTYASLATAAILIPALCHADSLFFPIADGWTWSYQAKPAVTQIVEIQGAITVIGTNVAVRDVQVEVGADSDHHENYWSDDGDAVFLHGFTTYSGGFSRAYDPPILWINPPLYVGKTWSTTTQVYSDLGGEMPSGDPFTVHLGVIGAAVIEVPAGTFMAYQIAQVAPTEPFSILGGRNSTLARGANVYEWVASGVGIVREVGSFLELFDLVSYGMPVSTEGTSWSRIKALYREDLPNNGMQQTRSARR